jgi:hypothetical protein
VSGLRGSSGRISEQIHRSSSARRISSSLRRLTTKPHIAQINRKRHCPNKKNSQPEQDKQHCLAGLRPSTGSATEFVCIHNVYLR